jgi:hypothetical protein
MLGWPIIISATKGILLLKTYLDSLELVLYKSQIPAQARTYAGTPLTAAPA